MTAAPGGPFVAVVLGGARNPFDAVAERAGVAVKVLAPVGGIPLILRVMQAVESTPGIGQRILSGPAEAVLTRSPALSARIRDPGWLWQAPGPSPALSAAAAMAASSPASPVLLTTADHALLSREMLLQFCAGARAGDADLAIGLCRHELVAAAFPDSRRTVWRFRDGGYCSCNLFAFMTTPARAMAAAWRRMELERKHPWRILRLLGLPVLLRYLAGQLSLQDGLDALGRRHGLRIRPVLLPFPEAAIDVDSVADWELANRIAASSAQ